MPRPSRKQSPVAVSSDEILGFLAEKIRKQAHEPNILAYKPHLKQEIFHRDTSKVRLYIGGNRSGKTVGGVVEDIYYLKGEHPFKKVPPPPVRGRVVCVDYNQGIQQIIIPKFKQWLPPSLLKNGSWDDSYHTDSKVLTLTNGSTVEFMTYEQKLNSFAGTSRHWVHFDEEPPKHIYDECQLRVLDTDGDIWLTMTPLDGLTWIYNELYEPVVEQGLDIGVGVTIVNINENPYLKKEAIDRILGTLDKEERMAREKGQFVQLGGKVYKNFSKEKHVIPFDDSLMEYIKHCDIYTTMDHGYNAPTAWLWHAVDKNGHVITFAEHYRAEMLINEHAAVVKAMEKDLKLPEVLLRIADPATQQRQGVTGNSVATEYALSDLYLSPGNNDVLAGVARVQKYLKEDPKTQTPRWRIADNCVNLIKEIQKLRWQTYESKAMQFKYNPQEKIHKKDDHACDAARYLFATIMPEILDEEPQKKAFERQAGQRYDEALVQLMGGGTIPSQQPTVWNTNPDSVFSLEGY